MGLWNLDVAVLEYHKKNGLECEHDTCTHVFEDGSELTLNIDTYEKEKNFFDPDDKEWYSAWVMTNLFEIREWAFEEKTFRTIESAKRYIHRDCKRTTNEVSQLIKDSGN